MRWRLDPGQIEVVGEDVAAVLRTKTAAQHIATATAAHRTARLVLAGDVRQLHPDWSGAKVAREVVWMMCEDQVGDDIARRASESAIAHGTGMSSTVTPAGPAH